MSNKGPKNRPSMRIVAAEAAARREAQTRTRRRVIWGSVAAVLVVSALVAVAVIANSGGSEPPASSAEAVALGCVGCHSNDGSRSEGPTWAGLAGSTVQLTDGTSVVADQKYLRNAIVDPKSQVVAGYSDTMPENQATDAQVAALVAYIQQLG